jgi:hypothetical protein
MDLGRQEQVWQWRRVVFNLREKGLVLDWVVVCCALGLMCLPWGLVVAHGH